LYNFCSSRRKVWKGIDFYECPLYSNLLQLSHTSTYSK